MSGPEEMPPEAVPRISVLMPAYNAERYVGQAVESILAQTFGDFEFLIIDDGSTDGTRRILEGFAARDPRIRLVSRPNAGLVATLNEMIGMARAPLLARMDADDIALPDRFERQFAFLAGHPEVVCVAGRVMLIDPGGNPLGPGHLEVEHEELLDVAMTGICPMNHPSVLMRAEAVRAAGGYRGESWPAEDLDLFLRLAEHGRWHNLPDVVTRYRLHPDSVSERHQVMQMARARRAVAEAADRLGVPDRFVERAPWRPSDRASTLRFALWFGWSAYRQRARWRAARYGLKAIAVSPWRQDGWRLLACSLLKSPRAEAEPGADPAPGAEDACLTTPEPRANVIS